MLCRIKGNAIIKALLVLPIVVFLSSSFASGASQESIKVGFINSQRIIDESIAGKDATKKMEQFKDENTKKMEEKGKEIEELESEIRKKEFAISPETKKDLEDKIRHKNLELKFFKEGKEKELKDLYYKSLKQIETDVLGIVMKIGQEDGYDLILGRDESGVLYANPKHDLTEKVIQIYDKQMQK